MVISDHKSLENWTTEILDQPGGPTGRRARWHLLLSKFKLELGYVEGENNSLADSMSRWAYPAGCGEDQFFNGTPEDEEKLAKLIEQEKLEEAHTCEIQNNKLRNFFVTYLSEIKSRSPLKVLDLFSGQGSWRNTFLQMGCEVISVDWNLKFEANIHCDILKWEYWLDFEPGDFDIICASVPCEHYIIARTTAPRNIPYANRLTKKTLEIIRYFSPARWFIENPRFGLLRDQPFMKNLSFIDVYYCTFENYWYKKPTPIWGPPQN